MRVITRGVPDFSYTAVQEVDNVGAFIAAHTLKVRRSFDYRAEYFTADTGRRVALYLEGIYENRGALECMCFNTCTQGVPCCTLKVGESGRVIQSGATRYLQLGAGYWYMIDTKRDARYSLQLASLRAQEREVARLAQIEQEQISELDASVHELVCKLGYAEALRRLRG